MYIDDCRHAFTDLATSILPAHLEKLTDSLSQPWAATLFSQPGQGTSAVVSALQLPCDFSGCYVLLDGDRPVYVGISRGVIKRLRQHMLGKTHFSASLAYSMAQRQQPTVGKRGDVMEDDDFVAAFQKAQTYLRTLSVGTVEINNPLELYVFEAYAAMSLGTSEWNTFRTH